MIDGNWVDICTIITGFIAMVVKPVVKWKCQLGPKWVHRDAVNDFLNGAVMFPFLLLLVSVFSTTVMEELVKHAKISLGLAGFIGALYVAKEIFAITVEPIATRPSTDTPPESQEPG